MQREVSLKRQERKPNDKGHLLDAGSQEGCGDSRCHELNASVSSESLW